MTRFGESAYLVTNLKAGVRVRMDSYVRADTARHRISAVVDPAQAIVAESDEVADRGLPLQSRFLCVGATEPSWVTLTLQLDALGCHEPSFRWLNDWAEALGLLREESFDCLLIEMDAARPRHALPGAPHLPREAFPLAEEPATRGRLASPESSALTLLRAIRASGCDDPIVVLSQVASDELLLETDAQQADLLISSALWNSRALATVVRRAVERVRLTRDHHRLSISDRRRSLRERDEAAYLLDQQRRILDELLEQTPPGVQETAHPLFPDAAGLEAKPVGSEAEDVHHAAVALPPEVDAHYQELLRTFVIIGSGTLAPDIRKLADLLAAARLTPREAMGLHLHHVEKLVRGLGRRSTRHVMARADLLALEVMIHLADCYRRQGMSDQGPAEHGATGCGATDDVE